MRAALGLLSRRFALRLLSCAPLAAPPVLRAFAAQPDQTPSEGVITPTGLRLFDFRTGEGPTPRWGQLVRLHYVGYTVSSSGGELEIFDSSYQRKDPYFTKHGNGQTVRGVEEALHSMRPGGRRRVIIGPAVVHHRQGPRAPRAPGAHQDVQGRQRRAGGAQPGWRRRRPALALTLALALALALAPPLRLTYPYLQPLVFDVELLSVMDDLLDRGDYDDGDPYLPRSP